MTRSHRRLLAMIWISAALLLSLTGCHQTTVREITEQETLRHWPPRTELAQCGEQPAIVFAPKAAYITGISGNKAFSKGTWIRARAYRDWPGDEPRPNLLIARVVEREKHWARLELLASVDSIRHDCLIPEETSENRLPAITKRLIFGKKRNGVLQIELGADDLITGREIYAAINTGNDESRFGSRIEGLWKPTEIREQSSTLTALAGTASENATLLLLSADVDSDISVVITVAAMPDGRSQEITQKLSRLIQENIHDTQNRIIVKQSSQKFDESGISKQLGGIQTNTLQIIVWWDGSSVRISTQQNRILRNGEGLWAERITPDESLVPAMAWIAALQLLGEDADVAYATEKKIAEHKTPDAWGTLAPALIHSYLTVERPDWALEALLKLESIASALPEQQKTWFQVALLDGWTRIGQTNPALFENSISNTAQAAWKNNDNLSVNDQLNIIHFLSRLIEESSEDSSQQQRQKLHEWLHAISQNKRITADAVYRQALLSCELANEDTFERICENALEKAQSDFERQAILTATETQKLARQPLTPEVFKLIEKNEALGAGVSLNVSILQRMAFLTENYALFEELIQRLAEYFYNAHQIHAFLKATMLLDAMSQMQTPPKFYSGKFAQAHLLYQYTLDHRTSVATALLQQTVMNNITDSAALDLLYDASRLFISNGDEANTAITFLRMARVYFALGQIDMAHQALDRAKAFAPGAGSNQVMDELEQVEALLK